MIVVTHYQRLLNEIVPDYVHVLAEGRIVKSGGKELALELEAEGYADLGSTTRGGGRQSMTACRGTDRRLAGALHQSTACARVAAAAPRARPSRASLNWASPPRRTKSGASPTSRPSRARSSTRGVSCSKFAKGRSNWSSPMATWFRPESLPRARSRGRRSDDAASRQARRFDENAFVALNTAMLADGAFVRVARGAVIEEPIEIFYLTTATHRRRRCTREFWWWWAPMRSARSWSL